MRSIVITCLTALLVGLFGCGGGQDVAATAESQAPPGAAVPAIAAASSSVTAAGDPAPGVVVAVAGAGTAAAPAAPTTQATTSSPMGPWVDKSKYASVNPANEHTTDRVSSVWNYPGPGPQYWYPCEPGSRPDCQAAPGNLAQQNLNDIGAFREVMPFAGMANDDPIVFPGQPGRSHSHTFFGNFVNAFTTSANIRDSAWCASAGGKLNCTAVWIPTVVDTLDGTPVVPGSMNFYYKGSYDLAPDKGKDIVPVPVGLHMISGDPSNKNPKGAVNARYLCMGPNGENPGWKPTIDAAVADGTCLPGGDFMILVTFPNCWDGVNLDSPDHVSHMSGVQQMQTPPFTKFCPATHPVQIPSMSVNAHYPITAIGQVARWRLASDMYDPSLPAGLSGHADYMMGWDPNPHPELWGENKSITQMWTTHCLNEQRDCHNYLIGDNRHMLN